MTLPADVSISDYLWVPQESPIHSPFNRGFRAAAETERAVAKRSASAPQHPSYTRTEKARMAGDL